MAEVIAVSDVQGGICDPKGLALFAQEKYAAQNQGIAGFPSADSVGNEQLLLLPCDILVPAAPERQITAGNAGKIRCRIFVEAANGPTTPAADEILSQRPDIFVFPDVLRNAGGVVVSYFEWAQDLQSFFWSETEIADKLLRILDNSWTQILSRSRKQNVSMRMTALSAGVSRVSEAKRQRGLFP